jgi:hypothetical protein
MWVFIGLFAAAMFILVLMFAVDPIFDKDRDEPPSQ